MKTKKDKYNLSRPSQTGKSGFEEFETNGSYYFHFNDEKGKALLFSQDYQSPKGRNRGMDSVSQNSSLPERFEKKQTKKGDFFFVLKAGNHQEIARSRDFSKSEDMEHEISILMAGNDAGQERLVSIKADTVEAPAASSRSIDKSGKFPKYSFRIDWYAESNGGRIEQILSGDSGETRIFKGLDAYAIVEFISSRLPLKPEEKALPAPDQKKKTSSPPVFIAPEESLKDIVLKINGEAMTKNVISGQGDFMMEMDLKNEPVALLHDYYATVIAKSLDNFSKVKVGENGEMVPENGKVTVPIQSNALKPGTYRLLASIKLKDQGKVLEGSRVIQVW